MRIGWLTNICQHTLTPSPRPLPPPPPPTHPAVYKAVCKRSNQVVVLKSYQLSAICELYQHQIFREVALHASLKHEHVVQLSGAFQVCVCVGIC